MKQSLFKIISLLFCLAIGFGCNDSNDWDTEGIDLHGRLTKIVESGVEVEIPEGIVTNPRYCTLSLKKDNTFQGIITLNDMEGTYQHTISSGKISIQIEVISEVLDARYHEFESKYVDLLRRVSSYKQSEMTLDLYFGENSYLQYSLIRQERN